MIEAVVTPLLLVLVAGAAGWRSGLASSAPVWRAVGRARAAWAILRGRSPLCAPCRLRLSNLGVSAVLCSRCDPVLVDLLLEPDA